jgi:hypothetical protein
MVLEEGVVVEVVGSCLEVKGTNWIDYKAYITRPCSF